MQIAWIDKAISSPASSASRAWPAAAAMAIACKTRSVAEGDASHKNCAKAGEQTEQRGKAGCRHLARAVGGHHIGHVVSIGSNRSNVDLNKRLPLKSRRRFALVFAQAA